MSEPISGAAITCDFGVPGPWEAGYHTGRDYRARLPVAVHATLGGDVVHAGSGGWGKAYGLHVVVESAGVRHLYAHLSKVAVQRGQSVSTGEQVGISGDTGNVTGPHLHYEERLAPFHYSDHREPHFDLLPAHVAALPAVSLDHVKAAFRADPARPQGNGLHPADVRVVEHALTAEGLLAAVLCADGYAGTKALEAYSAWQEKLGFTGAAADGIPGQRTLMALGHRHGFAVNP